MNHCTNDTANEASNIPPNLQERYSHWKKNTKLLYEYLNTNSTKWPSLTCQFFPDLDTTLDEHRILLSSFTSSQKPEDESIYISKISTLGHIKWSSLNNFDMDEMEFKPENSTRYPPKHLVNDISIFFPNGECNRARYLPQNPDIIAGASSDGAIYIFDRTKHGSTRIRQSKISHPFEAKLFGSHGVIQDVETMDASSADINEATSIAWNLQQEALLLSSHSNGQVQVWDIKQYSHENPIIDLPLVSINSDGSGVNDVTWMPTHDSLFAACTEGNTVSLLDLRTKKEKLKSNCRSHNGGVNSCKFNYRNSLILASADSNGKLNLWDIRNMNDCPLTTMEHGGSVSTLEWSPNFDTVLATAGQEDGLVKLWDTSREENIFTHGGHMLGVNDISWDAHDPWLMCSVANDNSVHIWKPAVNLVGYS
ncbi:hypothetical protein SMKI_02G3040 [Saccharomyces mikatae IFO 1815]|uniref:Msi1p n=1 Tax=Saccharomyces mikatae IFO 1815 TaxID=226126 RepID=A0AA35NF75_SACMI|nr:uncharacterized protein SMKI_02G3040 [Saccharomyces mikatae IFO 1815]CAI4037429.1 hypothetical protein SMKI_02G3040 [Saccharomyces mikatae IFO 1815]